MKSFTIAAIQSGSGKTTITLAFLSALKKRGFVLQSFKVGPDFIDPGHHKEITNRESINLDLWMFSKRKNREIFYQYSRDCDIAIIEGVMGLFDGKIRGTSTADVARLLKIPVLLIIDVSSAAESVAAIVKGFLNYDKRINIKWILFNNVGSEKHRKLILSGLSDKELKDTRIIGFLPKYPEISIPKRHLGLYTHLDNKIDQEFQDKLSEFIERYVDLSQFVSSIPTVTIDYNIEKPSTLIKKRETKKCIIAVAWDNAFCFYYYDNLRLLQEAGATIHYFSPLSDETLPDDIEGIYFGGGYPELHAKRLSENHKLISLIKNLVENKKVLIYAECGGLMYLSRYIHLTNGEKFKMLGLIPISVRMLNRRKALGYREVQLQGDCPLGRKGLKARGHEFHYSEIIEEDVEQNLYYVTNNTNNMSGNPCGKEGFFVDNVIASYVHIHFLSEPLFAKNLVNYCMRLKLGV